MRNRLLKLLPHDCLLCCCSLKKAAYFCHDCEVTLTWITDTTSSCKITLPTICAPFRYQYPINRFITQLKFHQQLRYARILSQLFLKWYQSQQRILPQVLIPVPLHKKRLRQRGFNQALEITKHLGRALQIPIDTQHCQRVKNTTPQSSLNAKQRRQNVNNAFHIQEKMKYQRIALVDDVITTGHTMQSLVTRYVQYNVHIECWSCALSLIN